MTALDGAPNFRDMGGIATRDGRTVAAGKLWRSGRLDQLTDADRRAVDGLAIALVIDLRSTFEVTEDGPGHLPAGARRLHLPIGDEPGAAPIMRARNPVELLAVVGEGGAFEWARNGCALMATTERNLPLYRSALTAIADGDVPVVFHCRAGKDRTGWLAACLLHLLGVERDAIMSDYLQSNTRLQPHWEVQLAALGEQYPDVDRSVVEPLMRVDVAYLEHAWAEVDAQFGSIDAYVTGALGVDDALRRRLCDLLLVD